MKLLICTQAVDQNHPILGFFHRWILEFSRYFEEVHVICLEKGDHALPENVFVYSLGKEEGKGRLVYIYRFYTYFWHVFFRVKVRFVFFHMGAVYNILAAPFFFLRRGRQTQFYWWKTHGHINRTGRIALWFVDQVFTAVAESFPVATRKRRVVGHAIDLELFRQRTHEPQTPILLFAGRLSRSKRVEQVLQVAKMLRENCTDLTVRIVGEAVDPGYWSELQEIVKEHELADMVTFTGAITQSALVHEYQQAKVFMNPSDNDGLDKVVLEAMACGAVPLTANRSFIAMLTDFGLCMEKGDIEGYAKRAKEIFALEPVALATLQTRLRAVPEANHSIDTLSDRIFKVA